MALINCPECNKEISDNADMCPHCGYKLRSEILNTVSKKKKRIPIILGVSALIFIACISIFFLKDAVKSSKEMIVGEWEVASMSPDGEHSYDVEFFKSMGYDVAGNLHVDDNSWEMTFSGRTEDGSWSKYEQSDDTISYILKSGTVYFASINENNPNVMHLLMDLGNGDKLFFTYDRKE